MPIQHRIPHVIRSALLGSLRFCETKQTRLARPTRSLSLHSVLTAHSTPAHSTRLSPSPPLPPPHRDGRSDARCGRAGFAAAVHRRLGTTTRTIAEHQSVAFAQAQAALRAASSPYDRRSERHRRFADSEPRGARGEGSAGVNGVPQRQDSATADRQAQPTDDTEGTLWARLFPRSRST